MLDILNSFHLDLSNVKKKSSQFCICSDDLNTKFNFKGYSVHTQTNVSTLYIMTSEGFDNNITNPVLPLCTRGFVPERVSCLSDELVAW